MGVRREKMPADIAPTDDLVLSDGNELRIAFLNHAHHELTRLRQWSCFQHGKVFFLPRDHVERMMKAVDMGGSDRLDPDAWRIRQCCCIHVLLPQRLRNAYRRPAADPQGSA